MRTISQGGGDAGFFTVAGGREFIDAPLQSPGLNHKKTIR